MDGENFDNTIESDAFRDLERLKELRISHRDLDDLIDRLSEDPLVDQLRLCRPKLRKISQPLRWFASRTRSFSVERSPPPDR